METSRIQQLAQELQNEIMLKSSENDIPLKVVCLEKYIEVRGNCFLFDVQRVFEWCVRHDAYAYVAVDGHKPILNIFV